MMDRTTALKTLKLDEGAQRSDILSSFNRLARRYPLQQFAERHSRLLQAKSALLNPDTSFRSMLFDESVNLNGLNAYTKETTKDTPKDSNPVHRCLEAICRPHFVAGQHLFPPDGSPENDIISLLDEMAPDELQAMIDAMPDEGMF